MAHKKDCQCIVCQRIKAKAAREVVPLQVISPVSPLRVISPLQVPPLTAAIDFRPRLGNLPIGTNFRFGTRVFKKLNDPGIVLDMTKPDDSSESLSGDTRVEIIGSGLQAKHEVEAEG